MSKSSNHSSGRLAFLFLAVAALLAGYFLATKMGRQSGQQLHLTPSDGGAAAVATIGKPRPDFTLPNLDDQSHSIAEWDGKVVLVNFWATWCPPCRREIPGFVEVYRQYHDKGFEVVGVAIDDPEAVTRFVANAGIDYTVLWGQAGATEVARRYGNKAGVLPFSVLIDRNGIVRLTRAGELDRDELVAALKQYL